MDREERRTGWRTRAEDGEEKTKIKMERRGRQETEHKWEKENREGDWTDVERRGTRVTYGWTGTGQGRLQERTWVKERGKERAREIRREFSSCSSENSAEEGFRRDYHIFTSTIKEISQEQTGLIENNTTLYSLIIIWTLNEQSLLVRKYLEALSLEISRARMLSVMQGCRPSAGCNAEERIKKKVERDRFSDVSQSPRRDKEHLSQVNLNFVDRGMEGIFKKPPHLTH